jgi:alcohol dehydrogenase YqhD (iron-dependent ADH family)
MHCRITTVAFSTSFVPEIRFGENIHETIGTAAASFGAKTATIVIDGFLAQSGLAGRIASQLQAEGIAACVFCDFAGEPKIVHVRRATEAVAGADVVIGIGGGSALDIAKIAACCAVSGEDAMHYALAVNPLPKNPLKKIMVPTTAGTGAETSATNIFAGPAGKKLWVWGAETKADLVLLDPVLTATLPANLTAWCGMDAFIHAFEAATNRNAHAGWKQRSTNRTIWTRAARCCSARAMPGLPSTIAAPQSPTRSATRWRAWLLSTMDLPPLSASRRRLPGWSRPIPPISMRLPKPAVLPRRRIFRPSSPA